MKKKNLKNIKKIYESYDNFIDSKSEKFLHHDYFHSHVTFSRNHLVGSEILINYIKDKFPKKKNFSFFKKKIFILQKKYFKFLILDYIFYLFKIILQKKFAKFKRK